jgi:hypothetical protein
MIITKILGLSAALTKNRKASMALIALELAIMAGAYYKSRKKEKREAIEQMEVEEETVSTNS